MEKISKLLYIFTIALSVTALVLIVAYKFSSGENAGQIGDALDWMCPLLLVSGITGMAIDLKNKRVGSVK